MSCEALANLSHEDRVFFPSEKFAAQANGKALNADSDLTQPVPAPVVSGPEPVAAPVKARVLSASENLETEPAA